MLRLSNSSKQKPASCSGSSKMRLHVENISASNGKRELIFRGFRHFKLFSHPTKLNEHSHTETCFYESVLAVGRAVSKCAWGGDVQQQRVFMVFRLQLVEVFNEPG